MRKGERPLFLAADFLGCGRVVLKELLKEGDSPWKKQVLLEDVSSGEVDLVLELTLIYILAPRRASRGAKTFTDALHCWSTYVYLYNIYLLLFLAINVQSSKHA